MPSWNSLSVEKLDLDIYACIRLSALNNSMHGRNFCQQYQSNPIFIIAVIIFSIELK